MTNQIYTSELIATYKNKIKDASEVVGKGRGQMNAQQRARVSIFLQAALNIIEQLEAGPVGTVKETNMDLRVVNIINARLRDGSQKSVHTLGESEGFENDDATDAAMKPFFDSLPRG